MIVAMEPPAVALLTGGTFSVPGAAPNEHASVAPEVTSTAIGETAYVSQRLNAAGLKNPPGYTTRAAGELQFVEGLRRRRRSGVDRRHQPQRLPIDQTQFLRFVAGTFT